MGSIGGWSGKMPIPESDCCTAGVFVDGVVVFGGSSSVVVAGFTSNLEHSLLLARARQLVSAMGGVAGGCRCETRSGLTSRRCTPEASLPGKGTVDSSCTESWTRRSLGCCWKAARSGLGFEIIIWRPSAIPGYYR